MGVLDDAIREHLELKRKHGAPEQEVEQQAQEALGPVRGAPAEPVVEDTAEAPAEEPAAEEPAAVEEPLPVEDAPEWEPPPESAATDDGDDEDVLEETPDFLQETPEHDRLWFEQKPPRDFDFDE
jgi:hypothetical protein